MNKGQLTSITKCFNCGFDVFITPFQENIICEHCRTPINLNTISILGKELLNKNIEGEKNNMDENISVIQGKTFSGYECGDIIGTMPNKSIIDMEESKMKTRGFETIKKNIQNKEVETLLPLRGTKTSAGYDFYTPVDLVIKPQEKVFFWTDVKAYMKEGEVLLLDVRSSMGVKNDLMLSNTMPVIDSDYYNNESNEGNIGISIRNLKPNMRVKGKETYYVGQYGQIDVPVIEDLTEENTVIIKAGDRVAQGFFVNYLPSDNCNSDEERKGGFGSSSK